MALKALGYRNDHPVLKKALEASHELIWELGDRALYMPCVSPNWDTALAAKALLDSGIAGDHPAMRKAAHGLSTIRFSSAATGRLSGPSWSPADGRSSFTTTAIPTWTTRR